MRINERLKTSAASRRAGAWGATKAATFALPEQPAAAEARGAPAVAVAGSLLAMQEVDPLIERGRQAKARGGTMLEDLERLRRSLLLGELPPRLLPRLREAARSRAQGADPALGAILADIELRVEVELAKLESGRYGRAGDPAGQEGPA